MIDSVTQWLQTCLNVTNRKNITFSIVPQRQHLKVTFNTPLVTDPRKEKSIFRSFAHLIMQAQRTSTKKLLKHNKIILSSK